MIKFILEHLEYREGILYVRKIWNKSHKAGDSLGHLSSQGYLKCRIHNKQYYIHKLVWMLHNGVCNGAITHLDSNKLNNRIENLAEVPKGIGNRFIRKDKPKSGFSGVYKGAYGRCHAYLQVNKNRIFIGSFATAEEASKAYTEAKEEAYKLIMGEK